MSVVKKTSVIVGYIVLAFLIILMLLYFVLDWFSPDIAAQDNSDLILSEIEMPRSNAYDDLTVIDSTTIKWPEYGAETKKIDDIISGQVLDQVFSTQLINNNNNNLAVFDNALLKDEYQSEALAKGNISENGSWGEEAILVALRLSKIKIIQALDYFDKGDFSTGYSVLLKVAQLGNKIQYSRNNVSGAMIGIGIKKDALTAINNNKEKINIPDEDKEIIKSLYSEDNSWYVNSVKMEFSPSVDLNDADAIYKRITGESVAPLDYKIYSRNSYFYKPNLTMKQYGDYYRNLIGESVVCREGNPENTIDSTITDDPKLYENNYIGKSQLNIILISLGSYSQKDCENRELVDSIIANK